MVCTADRGMLSADGQGMCRTRPLVVALSASILLACGSSEPSLSSVPEHPTFCSITATLTRGDGGIGYLTDLPSHAFTAAIDWAANTLTSGANGDAFRVPLVHEGDGWTAQASMSFDASQSSYPSTTYTRMTLRPTDTGCIGEASGTYSYLGGDVIYSQSFTATLAGTTDVSMPQVTVLSTDVDPLRFQGVPVNELLPAGTTAELVDDGGHVISMASLPDGEAAAFGVSWFQLQSIALAFGSSYTVRVLPALVDLAGNTAPSPTFTTLPDPGLFAQDGFEGAAKLAVVGNVQVVDAATLPVPTGTKALRFLPIASMSCADRFTVRMAVPAGASAVKFVALSFSPASSSYYDAYYTVTLGVPNGPKTSSYFGSLSKAPLTNPWKETLPGGTSYSYGDLAQYSVPLPAGTQGEVMFDLSRHCVEPPALITGLVVDDLRVE
jgi:hypothetical protein